MALTTTETVGEVGVLPCGPLCTLAYRQGVGLGTSESSNLAVAKTSVGEVRRGPEFLLQAAITGDI